MNAQWRRRGGWGGLLIALSGLLPWVGDLYGSEPGFRVPLSLAWDLEARSGSFGLGWVLVAIGFVVMVAAFSDRVSIVRQVFAGLALLLTVAVGVQVVRFASELGAGFDALLNGLAFGAYVSLVGSLIALFAGPHPTPVAEAAAVAVPAAVAVLESAPAAEVPETAPSAATEPGSEAFIAPCGHANRRGVRFCEMCGASIESDPGDAGSGGDEPGTS